LSATITGSTTVCKGTSNVVYTISNITNAASYVWTLPNGATGESTTNSISVSFSNDAESGDIKVKGFNDCGEGAESSLSVTVITIPENAGDISGNTTVCTGQTGVSYSVPEIANATSYTWAYSGTGATITGTTNSVTIDFVAVKNNDSIVKDIDGNSYNTVTIGTQEWMKENLKTTKYNDGTAIPNITNGTTWTGLSTPAYCWYNNDAATYKNTYGALYNWYTVNSGNLCSTGWHVPTDAEWTILENYLIANGYNYDGTTSGNNYAKALASETGWTFSSNTGAVGNTDYPTYRNKSGFTALPSGFRDLYGAFFHFGDEEIWWSSNEENIDYAWNRNMASIFSYLYRGYNRKTYGFSVRCLRDTAQQDTIYATSGNLTVQGTNSCGNGTESTLAITVTSIECPTGINVVSPPNKIIIYPNPTTGQLEISVDQSIGSDYKIEVYNNLGGLMQTIIKNSINNNFSLDLTDYPGGLYLIKLSNKENFYLSKIIKK